MKDFALVVVLTAGSLISFQASAGCKLAFLVDGSMSEFSVPHQFCYHKHE